MSFFCPGLIHIRIQQADGLLCTGCYGTVVFEKLCRGNDVCNLDIQVVPPHCSWLARAGEIKMKYDGIGGSLL